MKLIFKETAVDDILSSQRYIANQLHNPAAAEKLAYEIYNAALLICENPYMGARLSEKYELDTDMRYFTVARHLIFYRVTDERICVLRVIDGRQDYLSILF